MMRCSSRDGYQLHKIKPPLDLRSWQNQPVSTVANYQPVVIKSLSPAELSQIIDKYPYRYFSVQQNGQVAGLVSRENIKDYLNNKGEIEILAPAFAYEDESIKEIEIAFFRLHPMYC